MNRVRKAFTLVEILIVVIILGILAAIVVPQFTSASEDAQISNVESQLQTIRNQIELYRVKNNGDLPASLAAGTWDDLVSEDYLRAPPINPRTGRTEVVAGNAAAINDNAGWIWDAATRTIRAANFNENDELDTDGDPTTSESAWMD